jgi:hypothetical protein
LVNLREHFGETGLNKNTSRRLKKVSVNLHSSIHLARGRGLMGYDIETPKDNLKKNMCNENAIKNKNSFKYNFKNCIL